MNLHWPVPFDKRKRIKPAYSVILFVEEIAKTAYETIKFKQPCFASPSSHQVTAIEESKELSTLPLNELIGNLKVYKVVLDKDSESSKIKKEKYKSLALKARKVSSDEEESCSASDEEYAMAVRDFMKFLEEEENSGCWSDSEEEDDSKKDEIFLMALDNNEVILFVEEIAKTAYETIKFKQPCFASPSSHQVTAIEESKELSTLPLNELIGNLKVYKVVLDKDSESSKIKKEKYKSLALKARKVSSDEEESCSASDEEYAMAVRDFMKFLEEEENSSINRTMT
uniref:UBN2 domain-containing protein n=1 Tax=Tanacetum cinerariifolium TaxID=118510 RepID=A0A6L2NR89_TANCI|nr:UBN2 domain-containing protein [Tanacetum cinerariifolium]